MNRTIVIGRMTAAPERRVTSGGKDVTSFRVDDEGTLFRVTAWEEVGKGVPEDGFVLVEGRQKTREYTTSDGDKRQTTELIASSVLAITIRESTAAIEGDDDLPF